MARKPPDWRQPLLFPPDPDHQPEPQDNATLKPSGDQHAVQNDRPQTSEGTEAAARTAVQGAQAPFDDGALRQGAEEQPRSLEGSARPDAAGQRPEPSGERSPGDSPQGAGGSFTLRVSSGRQRGSVPRRGHDVHPPSHVARLKASRRPPTLFDSLPPPDPAGKASSAADLPSPPAPPEALDGTVISPPGRASGQSVPPEGLPQFSAGPVAARAEPRLGTDSLARRQAPDAGPVTPEEGDHAMQGTQLTLPLDAPTPFSQAKEPVPKRTLATPPQHDSAATVPIASGEKSKARDIIAAIRTLKAVEQEKRPATFEEKQILARFSGFGPVALSIFPDPVSGRYKDAAWQAIGDELKTLLTPQEYESAKRTTFNAFYTSPTVIAAMHEAISRLGVPGNACVLEPGCGTGNFMSQGSDRHRFIGVELDAISGRIARAIHPQHDIRIENFRDTKLSEDRIDAVIGNVPFADLKLDYRGQKLSLHDFFFAKSIDALKPGGVLALVTTHYTLDKQNPAIRDYLGSKADFVGAIRLPSDAFKRA